MAQSRIRIWLVSKFAGNVDGPGGAGGEGQLSPFWKEPRGGRN